MLFSSIFNSYTQNASYQVNGNASSTNITDRNGTISCKCFELTPNYFINPSGGVGSVWNKNKIDLNNSFVLDFDVYLGSNDAGADGIAFGLQQSSSSVGVAGNGMGLGTINPSLGVYLDTYQNSDLNDPVGDHISIQKNGDVTHYSSNELAGPMTVSNLEDNSFKRFKIEWNSTTQVFNVYLINMITPILSYTGDIINNIFSGDPLVYWGFTGATGGSFNLQKFCTNTDLESPEFSSCPTDVTIILDENNCSSIYNFITPTATDNCGSTNTVQTSGLPSGSLFPIGVTTNTWVSTDLAGNTTTCSFDITVSGIDSDGDNIVDLCDVDDDNDGILDINEGVTFFSTLDSDGDGTPDYLDLDSDNDGIYDITEGGDGAADINNDGKIDINDLGFVDSDNNGMDDNAEITSELDSDSDNIKDFLDLDSDNDGCYDVIEAGYTDNNSDGILGPINPIFDVNGKVTSGIDGYTQPLDIDINNFYDFTEIGPNQSSSESATACVSYFWNGVNYNTSGTYTFQSNNIIGCDSIVTLNLTINNPVVGDTNALVCDSLLWYGMWYDSTGAYTHTLTAANGCDSIVTLNLEVNDYIDPAITCPNNQTNFYNTSCGFSLLDYTSLATTVDNCNYPLSMTQLPTPGSIISNNTTINLTVTDNYNNSSTCSFNLSLIDSISPSIISISDTVNYYTNNCDYTIPDYTSLLNTTDNCDLIPTITQLPAAGTLVSSDTVISLLATDDSGNSSSCSFNLTLVDTIKPIINCFGDTSDYFNENCLFVLGDYTNRAIVNDNCDNNLSIVQTPSPGIFLISDTIITLTVTDFSNNSSSCSFNLSLFDSITPLLICPLDATEYYNSNCEFVVPDYTLATTSSDNCYPNPILVQSPPSGTVIFDDTVITITSTDYSGNFTTCSFNIIILDTINPIVSCIPSQILYLDTVCNYLLPNYMDSITSSDNCDTNLVITQYPVPNSTIYSDTIVIISVTDNSGNNTICEIPILLLDTISPVISCPNNTVLDNDSSQCGAIFSYLTPLGIDNCLSTTTLTSGLPDSSLFPVGLTTNVYRVTDTAGNFSTCSFYVLVNDVESPTITCPSDTVEPYDQNCEFTVPDYSNLLIYSDNCGIEIIDQIPAEGTIVNYDFETFFTITDSSGNSKACSYNISLYDLDVPDIVCPSDQDLMLDENCVVSIPDFSNELQVGALCSSSKTIYQSPSADTLIDFIGVQNITFNVFDTLGNVETCSFNLNIINNDINNCYKLFIPTVFSPDGDGINDIFQAYGLDKLGLEIEIYNRWGQMVHKTDLNNLYWDGTFMGEKLPNETYVYRVFYLDGSLKIDGTISIVR